MSGSRHLRTTFRAVPPLLAVLALAGWAAAAEEEAEDNPGGVDDVGASIDRRNSLSLRRAYDDSPMGRFMRPWYEWRKKFFEDIGLEMRFAYDAYAQGYFGNGSSLGGSAGEAVLDGRWFLFGKKFDAPVYLGFRLRDRHRIGGRAPADIGEDIGAYWGTIRGFNNAGFEIPDFFLEQELFDGRLDLRYGQMNVKNLFDGHAMRSSKQAFANRAFSESPGVAFPRFGAGFYARWQDEAGWEISGGFANIQGTSDEGGAVDFDLGRGDLFTALQVGWKFDGWNDERARVKLLAWHTDPLPDLERPEGEGVALTIEQRLCDGRDRIFARYAFEEGGATMVDQIFSFGYGTDMREFDRVGLAFGVGRRNGTDQWQWVAEGFYRWQITPEFMIAPDMQILYGDGFHDGNGPHFIAGLHGEMAF